MYGMFITKYVYIYTYIYNIMCMMCVCVYIYIYIYIHTGASFGPRLFFSAMTLDALLGSSSGSRRLFIRPSQYSVRRSKMEGGSFGRHFHGTGNRYETEG